LLIGPLAFVLADLLVVVSAACVVARLPLAGRIDRAVAFGTLAVAQMQLSLFLTGAGFDSLRRPALLAVNAVFAAVALLYGGRQLWTGVRGLHRPPNVLGVARSAPWAAALAGLAGAGLIWRIFVVAVLPPFAWDALSYHLTTTAEWIQKGHLVTNPLSLCCAHYPLNAELTFVWPGLLTGNDTLIDGVQIGFALLGALAVAGIVRVIGVSRAAAVAGGSIFFLTPVILAQSNTNYNDIAFTSMFLCGLFFVLRWFFSAVRPRVYLALAGLAAGYALGTKGTGVLYAGVLLVLVAVMLAVKVMRGSVGRGSALGELAVFGAALLLLGGFWYARNLVDHGNPVYPFDLTVAGVRIFSGPLHLSEVLSNPSQYRGESNWVRVLHSWVHDGSPTRGGDGFYEYEERVGGFGIVWPWLLLPALAVFVVFAARRRRDLLLALIIPVTAIFLLQPYQWWSRFTMVLPAIGAVALVHLVDRVPRRGRTALQVATCVLVFFGAALATGKIDPAGHGQEITAFRVVRLAFEPGKDRTLGKLFHHEYAWLDGVPDNVPMDVELGYEPRFVYPAFGSRFERRVRALRSINARRLRKELARDDPAYLFVGRNSALDRAAARDPALTAVYRDYRVSAYRVLQGAAANG
jgi:Dolichyl-phosphate-mannose-protein mannosyltransferase